MKIDIFNLTSKKITSQEIDLSLELDKLFDGYEYIGISKPIIVKGTLTLVEDIINLNARLTTECILACSRCLVNYKYLLEIDVYERFSRTKREEDDEVIFIESDRLDITEIIESNVYLALPVTRLCMEECKGLCQSCGTDLNLSTCGCNGEVLDLRLAKLKELFSKN